MPWWAYCVLLTITLTLAILRMTRFVTTDKLGQWLLDPIYRWAGRREQRRRVTLLQSFFGAEETAKQEGRTLTPEDHARLAEAREKFDDPTPLSWQARLVSGLWCPFCVGFHLAWIMIALTLALVTVPVASIIWHVILAALAINYVTAHISARIDSAPDEDTDSTPEPASDKE